MDRVERKLAAILAADVAGYSRLMGADEEGTLAALKAHRRELIDPKITEHRGRIVKTTGDGILVEFPSVVDALRCAVEVQKGMVDRNAGVPEEKCIEFRVGINLGDIIIDGDDIHGDGVNIAARLEALAEPGGICVSRKVREEVGEKANVSFEDMGDQTLKNIASPVRAYHVQSGAEPKGRPTLALPDKPSIAVLPFQNMSGDPEQEYFADGVVEEIITALSRFRQLFVIARNSSFAYKGKSPDIRQVGRELGVRYVLEGSVRKAGNRLRITGQLLDASTGAHLWAERFDGGLEDVFDLQDQVTTSVVGAIAPKLEQAEIDRAKQKATESLDAYEYYLRGLASAHQFTREANERAIQLFTKAIELDANFAAAYGGAVRCYVQQRVNGWMVDRTRETAEAALLARRAVLLGKNDAGALTWGGLGLATLARSLEDGAAFLDRARVLNPNFAAAWHVSALIRVWLGEPEAALEYETRAMRLSPLDPLVAQMETGLAHAHFFLGHNDDASSWADKAVRDMPSWVPGYLVGAASHALAGRPDNARALATRLRQLNPTFRVSHIRDIFPHRRSEDLVRYEDGLRKAGLPE